MRVLVVDDEPNLPELLTSALRLEGMDVAAAPDGTSALRMVRQSIPDIVVLDVMLPDMEGFTVLRRLREQEARIPVPFLDHQTPRTPATHDGDGPTKHKCPAKPKPDGALMRDSSVTAGDSESATRSSGIRADRLKNR